jgi:bifunctional UDP-N-acetylglucosamine pyrophosphorylase/glucosamine-1-phosphate N-acetyltransferase
MSKAAIILAAGQGTRMKSALPKVLHKVAGLPLLGHVAAALKGAGVDRIVVVTSAAGEDVRAYAATLGAASAIQQQQLGTGHAAASAHEALGDFSGTLLIVNGDLPLITSDTIGECVKAQGRTGLALLAFEAAEPGAYGRVLRKPDGSLDRIVEYKDATAAERGVTLCNAGCYAADGGIFSAGRPHSRRQCPEGILFDRRSHAGPRRRPGMRRRGDGRSFGHRR